MKRMKVLGLALVSLLVVGCVLKKEPMSLESSEYVMTLPGSSLQKENTYTMRDIRNHVYQFSHLEDFLSLKESKSFEAEEIRYELVSVEDDMHFDEFVITLKCTNLSEEKKEVSPIGVVNGYYDSNLFGYVELGPNESGEVDLRLSYKDLFYMGAKDITSFGILVFDEEGDQDRLFPFFEFENIEDDHLKSAALGAVLLDEANVKVIAKGLDLQRGGIGFKVPMMIYQKQGEATIIQNLQLEINGENIGEVMVFPSAMTKNLHTSYLFVENQDEILEKLEKQGIQNIHFKGSVQTASGEYTIDKELKFQ